MKETEDQGIADKFRQVFEDYDDPSSNEGWKELRKKYPETKNRPIFFWLSSAAALFLILSGLWFSKSAKDQESGFGNNKAAVDPPHADRKIVSKDPEINNSAIAGNQNIKAELNIKSAAQLPIAVRAAKPKTGLLEEIDKIPVLSKPSGNLKTASGDSVVGTAIAVTDLPESPEKVRINPDSIALMIAKEAKTDLNINLKTNGLNPVKEKKSKSEKNNSKNIILSLYAGSFVNYAEGSKSNVNAGAGFSSDFRISKNLKISTGLNLSKNSLDYNQNIPGNTYGSFQNSQVSGIRNLVAVSSYHAELLSLDIPLNVKYFFKPEKNTAYFLAGLSSGTYLNETYGIQYNNFNTLVGIAAGQEQKIKKQMQDFDLMRTLNLSFGFNTRLSKKQSITIEPFVKYPLGGLGSENLKFGASGINVKLNFSTKNSNE